MSTNSRLILTGLVAIIVAIGTLGSFAQAGQEKNKDTSADKREDVIELNKHELATKVTIAPVTTDLATLKQQYSASDQDDKQLIRVSMTNTAAEPIRIVLGSQYIHYRPRLSRDGRVIPYKEALARILQARDKDGSVFVSVKGASLQPNETIMVDYIDLAKWYGPLEPGQYELTIKYRFRHRGKPIETNMVTFEIVP